VNDMLTDEKLNLPRAADSPTIANVIELFGIRSFVAGYTNHEIRAVYPDLPPVVGYAVTATFRAGFPAESDAVYSDMPRLIADSESTPEPRIMVFQDLDDPVRAATYGEVMASTFQRFGFAGLITSGAGRDIEQVRRLQFPCWASSILVSHGYSRIEEIGVPVTVGGLQIRPGELIHADANGIIEIPARIAEAVADLCKPFMDAEQITLDYLKSPNATTAGYAEAVARMRSAIDHLRSQARESLEN